MKRRLAILLRWAANRLDPPLPMPPTWVTGGSNWNSTSPPSSFSITTPGPWSDNR